MLGDCRRPCLDAEAAAEIACAPYFGALPAASRTAGLQCIVTPGTAESARASLIFPGPVLILGMTVWAPYALEPPAFVDYTDFGLAKLDADNGAVCYTAGPENGAPFVLLRSLCLPLRALNIPLMSARAELGLTVRMGMGAIPSNGMPLVCDAAIIYRPIGWGS